MTEEKIYIRVCKSCKGNFESNRKNAYICPGCSREHKLNMMNKSARERNSGFAALPLRYIIRLMMRYNSAHGTDYSYGKFVAAIRCGIITPEDFQIITKSTERE